MNTSFKADYYRMTGINSHNHIKISANILLRHNIRFMYLFRKYQESPNFLIKFLLYRMGRKYGLEISVDSQIGPGLYLGHPYNITVAEGSVIGKNVNLHKGCTIGQENRGSRKGVPTIGDEVYIGINAVIVGGIHIGSDVLIAPNAFVNFDVPDHSVVLGNPGIIHKKEDAAFGYVGFCV